MSSGTGSNYPAQVISGENTGINQAFQPFPYPNTTQAANNAYSGIANDTNPGGQSALNYGGMGAINYGNQLPGTLAPISQQGLTSGSNIYNTLSGQAGVPVQQGKRLNQQGQTQYAALAPFVTQALQQGFDPQSALYNRSFQQQQQQNLASQAMSGVGQSPYASGLTAQGNENFNIDWQNQQLARQGQAAQTAEGLSSGAMGAANTGLQGLLSGYQTGAGMDTAAMNALSSGISDYLGATGLGISGLEGLLGTGGNALTQAGGLNAQQVQQYLAYLQGSTNNASAATGAQLGSLQQGTNLYGATNQGNYYQQQLTNQGLGGLGQLGGTLGGAALLGGLL